MVNKHTKTSRNSQAQRRTDSHKGWSKATEQINNIQIEKKATCECEDVTYVRVDASVEIVGTVGPSVLAHTRMSSTMIHPHPDLAGPKKYHRVRLLSASFF